jgi:hypothetical protein
VDGHQRAKDSGQVLFANLPFIHVGPREVTTGPDVAEALHQRVHFLCAPRLRCILLQPFPKNRIEGFVLGAGNKPGLLDEVCVRTQCDVFHTETVRTTTAQSSSRLILLM